MIVDGKDQTVAGDTYGYATRLGERHSAKYPVCLSLQIKK